MAVATVFVDDVVTGRLPAVCVRSGLPADTWVRDQADVGGPQPWLLVLVFLGPPGWLALVAVVVFGIGRERLQVQLPFAQAELDRVKSARDRRTALVTLAVVLALGGLVFASAFTGPVGYAVLAVIVGAVALATVAHLRVTALEVGVSLDVSRRWVTLRNVSAEFAAQARADQHQRAHRRD